MARPCVAVFSPDPLLSVTIELRGGANDLHLHPAGQGVWLSHMVAEMGARPILCGLCGGETGDALRGLLARTETELRLVAASGSTGSYLTDRREGRRQLLATCLRPAPARHELDDLVALTCSAVLDAQALVLCNPFPPEGIPLEVYETIAANAKSAGVPILVDLSSPRLESVLAHEPELVKLNDWELAEYVLGPVDGDRALDAAMRLRAAGARNVAVTRAEQPILVVPERGDPFELAPPALAHGFREGCGDTMMGAVAAAWVQGLDLRETLSLGAAAGASNFLRHGLGTGRREAIESLCRHVTMRPCRAQPAHVT